MSDSTLAEATRSDIDSAIESLETGARIWANLTVTQRSQLLERVRMTVAAVADDWVEAASRAKSIDPGSPLRGEEWLTGPYVTLQALSAYGRSLAALAAGKSPLEGISTDTAPGGRLRIHAFPAVPLDHLVLSGFRGEIWLEPGVSLDDAHIHAGLAQRHPRENHGIGLVLGAGNVTGIPVLDAFYELLAAGRVVLLKLNPTQDALADVFRRALAPLIEPGFVRIVTGGGDVGAYLTQHPGISHVHITGSAATFDAIVWGGDKERADPALQTPITAELGGVAPVIVVPGAWSDADLRYQAEHIVTMRLHNGGHNCVAGQVVIISRDWHLREKFLEALGSAYRDAPDRAVWYPRSDEKLATARRDYPEATWSRDGMRALVDLLPGEANDLETTEYFAPVLGVVELAGSGLEFLDAAVVHANNKLVGTLGANVLIDPATESALGAGFERAISDLHYGGIAINTWTGVVFATPVLSWGAYPGGTISDVGSGLGVVHNALLLDRVERSVLRGPFRPFPRSASIDSVRHGQFSVIARPPWFVTSRTADRVGEGLTKFQTDHDPLRLARTLALAMRA
ncbi:acyl-CoA reductase-like NAD-dependent aldehyde dehydrogenase [Microbacterium halimionae]|uniref:Acyl-CoA reductase-like NAD-dependent aldehyde dehydrogenase n=1 Tax=Microbacterium halimionae TaxID=1526413 RepID=A0A7W3JQ34_9MICO|nr:aldehyde dehydrogenase family protein [Microbacterium halimionae]MBA8816925.1 acyl-CoA reductase-like NAD-dependent aldehyde dehydrogenase [Microbacterium halimionae]NII94536.1 acyl-CoA reductase-like NAD-dependent aldehyde dehydrogenase [Microbacterium halimionae]